jgi:subtilisin family serine protease
MAPARPFILLCLATAAAVLATPVRGHGATNGIPPICLPLGLPVLLCPPAPVSRGERQPGIVTPTTVRYDPRRIVVGFKKRTLASAINTAFARAGVRVERNMTRIRLWIVSAPEGKREEALASLRREKAVESVEREVLLDGLEKIPNDPAWPDQWGLRTAGFPKAWDITRGSPSVVVAVLDTGVDASHPELKGALVAGRDIIHGNDNPADDNGHGTAVAGVVAARGDNGIGLAGACWLCRVMPVKVLGADGTGMTADVAAGIIWAADHGARVINMSLGGPGTTAALSEAIQYAAGKDTVVIASAGNNGLAIPFYPAAESSVIGVAASNEDDRLYSWSNHGAWVQVAAPGCNDAPWPGGGYVSFCGTSAAAPLVAGVAALIRSARPNASAEQTAQAVNKSVDTISDEVRNGRVNAWLALSGLRPSTGAAAATTRRTNTTVRGRLGGRIRSRAYRRRAGAGAFVAVLRFNGARGLSLFLVRPGRAVVRISGKSPLRLKRTLSAGPITLVVKAGKAGKAKTSYRLTLSYAMP